ncbi:MAG: hypothetical protein KAR19_05280 [Bacteroidales bacterium]|nr:hypothetical protein [Bacteroidales bacterium]
MAKKKANKKELKKKDAKKKANKKELKKKYTKKKDAKKKKSKKKNSKKKLKKVQPLSGATLQPKAQENEFTDHSSNYKVLDAVKKLRSLKNPEELLAFTKGEKRLTIKKVIPAAMKRLKK